MVNCGGIADLAQYVTVGEDVHVFVLDSHRPYHLANVWEGNAKVLLLDDKKKKEDRREENGDSDDEVEYPEYDPLDYVGTASGSDDGEEEDEGEVEEDDGESEIADEDAGGNGVHSGSDVEQPNGKVVFFSQEYVVVLLHLDCWFLLSRGAVDCAMGMLWPKHWISVCAAKRSLNSADNGNRGYGRTTSIPSTVHPRQ